MRKVPAQAKSSGRTSPTLERRTLGRETVGGRSPLIRRRPGSIFCRSRLRPALFVQSLGAPDWTDVIEKASEIGNAVKTAVGSGKPTVINLVVDSLELAEPFRRDALKKPVRMLDVYKHLTG